MIKTNTKKLAIAGVFCAVAVVGSLFSFPVFGSKCSPVQHMVNILCAVLLGPGYGVGVAFAASLIRNMLSLGSLMAFPGSMFGALVCGLVYRRTKNILGTLIGAICIVLVNQFGYIASISGVVMGVCALKGYQILGKKMSLKGIIICVILILLMVYISNWFSYAVAVAQVYKADIVSSFLVVPELIKEGAIESGAYYKDLLMLYVFTAIGAVPVIKNQIKGK